jgi:COMPASS component SDC1
MCLLLYSSGCEKLGVYIVLPMASLSTSYFCVQVPKAESSSRSSNLLPLVNYEDELADMTRKKGANRKKKSSPAAIPHAPSPLPGRTGTPAQGSRAASAHPDPGFTMPAEAPPHGDSTRRYLNTKVTAVLLEGMKQLAKDQ